MSIQQRIKTSRQSKKISRKILANKLGVSVSAICSWETRKKSIPGMSNLIKLSKFLDVDLDWLCKGNNYKEPIVFEITNIIHRMNLNDKKFILDLLKRIKNPS